MDTPIMDIVAEDGKLLGRFNTLFIPGYWRWSGKIDKQGRPEGFRYVVFYDLTTEERERFKKQGIVLRWI